VKNLRITLELVLVTFVIWLTLMTVAGCESMVLEKDYQQGCVTPATSPWCWPGDWMKK